MSRTTHSQTVSCSEFLLHEPTHRVGLVVAGCGAADIESSKTIRLAEGESITAPAREFRPATGTEVQHYHRLAAATQPLVNATVSTAYLHFEWEEAGD